MTIVDHLYFVLIAFVAPTVGFFSFGEIGPGHDGALALQNQTALLALLEERTS